jgi:hypothetical protein
MKGTVLFAVLVPTLPWLALARVSVRPPESKPSG